MLAQQFDQFYLVKYKNFFLDDGRFWLLEQFDLMLNRYASGKPLAYASFDHVAQTKRFIWPKIPENLVGQLTSGQGKIAQASSGVSEDQELARSDILRIIAYPDDFTKMIVYRPKQISNIIEAVQMNCPGGKKKLSPILGGL